MTFLPCIYRLTRIIPLVSRKRGVNQVWAPRGHLARFPKEIFLLSFYVPCCPTQSSRGAPIERSTLSCFRAFQVPRRSDVICPRASSPCALKHLWTFRVCMCRRRDAMPAARNHPAVLRPAPTPFSGAATALCAELGVPASLQVYIRLGPGKNIDDITKEVRILSARELLRRLAFLRSFSPGSPAVLRMAQSPTFPKPYVLRSLKTQRFRRLKTRKPKTRKPWQELEDCCQLVKANSIQGAPLVPPCEQIPSCL